MIRTLYGQPLDILEFYGVRESCETFPRQKIQSKTVVLKKLIRENLGLTFSAGELKRWFDPLDIKISSDNRYVEVDFPHHFFAQWFMNNIKDRFEEQLGQFLGLGFDIIYRNNNNGLGRGEKINIQEKVVFPFGNEFTFNTYIINKKNFFPWISAKEVANLNNSYNPFIICGESGTGKTHLLKAVANKISKKHDLGKIFFGDIEDIHNIYNNEFKKDHVTARNHLFGYEFLLIDDFPHIVKYKYLQQELIIIFNYFYDNRKQMIFGSSEKIALLKNLDNKLKSRLELGLVVNLNAQDLDIRVKYIQRQCQNKKIPLTNEQILALAQRFEDFRYLKGILLKLHAFKELVAEDISDKDLFQIIEHTDVKPAPLLTIDRIMEITAEAMGFSSRDLLSSKRQQRLVLARHTAMFLCRDLLGASYPALGRHFGGKDHSTVLYAIKKINKLQNDNKEIKNLVTGIKKKCLESDKQGT